MAAIKYFGNPGLVLPEPGRNIVVLVTSSNHSQDDLCFSISQGQGQYSKLVLLCL